MSPGAYPKGKPEYNALAYFVPSSVTTRKVFIHCRFILAVFSTLAAMVKEQELAEAEAEVDLITQAGVRCQAASGPTFRCIFRRVKPTSRIRSTWASKSIAMEVLDSQGPML
jgi:hypothetical protein